MVHGKNTHSHTHTTLNQVIYWHMHRESLFIFQDAKHEPPVEGWKMFVRNLVESVGENLNIGK